MYWWNMSRLTAQSPRALFKYRTGVWPGSWNEICPPPSHFCFLGFPALQCFLLGWKENSMGRTSHLGSFPLPERAGCLSRQQAFDHCNCKAQRACQLILFTSLTGDSESQEHTGDFPGFMDLDSPRPATHFWFVCSQCPGICSVGNFNWEPIAPQLLSIKMCNWISHVCLKHHSKHDLQATV